MVGGVLFSEHFDEGVHPRPDPEFPAVALERDGLVGSRAKLIGICVV